MKKVFFVFVLFVMSVCGGIVYFANNANVPFIGVNRVQKNTDTNDVTNAIAPSPPNSEVASSVPIRGVVEGFYGTPWTTQQRMSMFQFMEQNHFNTYVYAPKDDPYQRMEWGDLYPGVIFQQMQALVHAAASEHITFVYSISPGIPSPVDSQHPVTQQLISGSITFTAPYDKRRLEAKVDQLRDAGVHTFMLSFDDVEKYLKPADKAVYGSDYAKAQVDLANTLLRDERQKDPSFQLWFAPTTYYGLTDNHEWQTIRTRLNHDISVIWTGKWVLNASITSQQADEVARWLGRKPLLWDNYPVNDYTYVVNKAPALLLGPIEHRDASLPAHLDGYMANPMIQPEVSKIPLATIGAYLADPSKYQYLSAWKEAVSAMVGAKDPQVLFTICEYASKSPINKTGLSPFPSLAGDYWKSRGTSKGPAAEAKLREELQTLKELPANVQSTVTNEELLREITPWVTKLAAEGEAGLLALDYMQLPATDPAKPSKHDELKVKLQRLHENSLSIGDDVLKFADDALSH